MSETSNQFQPGVMVKFRLPFENADARIDRDEIGIVRDVLGNNDLVVEAKGIRWVCKPWEIKPAKFGPSMLPIINM